MSLTPPHHALQDGLHAHGRTVGWDGSAWMLGVLWGTALQLQQRALWASNGYMACMGLAALGLIVLMRIQPPAHWRWLRTLLVMSACAALVFGLAGWRADSFASQALKPELEGPDLQIQGTIVAMPQVRDAGTRFRFAVESASMEGKPVALPELIELSWYARGMFDAEDVALTPLPPMTAGERWSLTVRLKAPHGDRNPFGFDFELWMWEQGVQASGYVRAGGVSDAPRKIAAARGYLIERLRQHVRDAIFERLIWSADAPDSSRRRAAGVVAALVTGDQRAIDRKDWDVFRVTGVAHLVSISGLHITMFAWLAATFIGAAWRRIPWLCLRIPAQRAGLVGGVLLATAYALFSGWGVPAQRTILMLAVIGLLRWGGKRWPWPQVWLLACALVLLWDPWAMLQTGFWLSFVAVGVLFASNLQESDGDTPDGAQQGLLRRMLSQMKMQWRQQWVVTLAVTPLTILLFGQMSVVSFAANMFAIPWVTLVVLPFAFGGVVWPALWEMALWFTQCFNAVLQWFASWPMAQLSLASAPLWAGIAAVVGGVVLALRLPWKLRMLALPCVLPALWWSHARPDMGVVELLAADVGQGQAVLVRTATHSLLYDTGPRYSADSDAGERILVPLLRALGERLDVVMLSHRDADHTGGAAAVLAQQPHSALIASMEGDHPLSRLRPMQPCVAGQAWSWDGVQFKVLHPPVDKASQLAQGNPARLKPNAVSCVLQITDAHGVVALLVGDLEQPQERDLLALGVVEPVQYLLVPHHGSKTSSSPNFLDALRPQIGVVQAGYRNRFGHPAEAVVMRYRERNIPLAETPACGAVGWRSDRPEATVCEREHSLRYWHHRVPSSH